MTMLPLLLFFESVVSASENQILELDEKSSVVVKERNGNLYLESKSVSFDLINIRNSNTNEYYLITGKFISSDSAGYDTLDFVVREIKPDGSSTTQWSAPFRGFQYSTYDPFIVVSQYNPCVGSESQLYIHAKSGKPIFQATIPILTVASTNDEISEYRYIGFRDAHDIDMSEARLTKGGSRATLGILTYASVDNIIDRLRIDLIDKEDFSTKLAISLKNEAGVETKHLRLGNFDIDEKLPSFTKFMIVIDDDANSHLAIPIIDDRVAIPPEGLVSGRFRVVMMPR